MTKLSVNINKIATIRNSRGGNTPSVEDAAVNCEKFGAEGITVHPRPDARHIRYDDVYKIKSLIKQEFNIEGYPTEDFIRLVLDVKPAQVTLVPDAPDAITSNAGWDCITNKEYLKEIVAKFKAEGIRVSIFLDPDPSMVKHAFETGTDRIELYTEGYATNYKKSKADAIAPYIATAAEAQKFGLGVNAGHDLSLENLRYFAQNITNLNEVSIGHALISDALYLGLENTIQLYLRELKK
ncbi:MAG: pyridoxine 5'-phosphate synthase [Rikenellaceae bacterium]